MRIIVTRLGLFRGAHGATAAQAQLFQGSAPVQALGGLLAARPSLRRCDPAAAALHAHRPHPRTHRRRAPPHSTLGCCAPSRDERAWSPGAGWPAPRCAASRCARASPCGARCA